MVLAPDCPVAGRAPRLRLHIGGEHLRRLVLEPRPGLGLRRPGCLAHGDLETGQFGLNFCSGQEMKATDQHRALDHRRLRAIEALEGRVRGVMRDAAHETRPELMFAHLDDDEFEMRQSRRQARRCDKSAGG